KLRFDDAGDTWGFTTPSFSNGAAYGDLDNDGDLDLVVNNVNMKAFLYRNQSEKLSQNKHLTIRLKGKDRNTFAIGAKITAWKGNEQLSTQVIPSRGFQSSVDYPVIFGLGTSASADSVVVVWPDRSKSVLNGPVNAGEITMEWKEATVPVAGNQFDYKPVQSGLVRVEPALFKAMKEDNFVDFYPEGLTFRMISREGPKPAIGDVNGDGFEDVYVGAPAGETACLYLQSPDGSFKLSAQTAFVKDSAFEDTAALFFDADRDNDLDLFVGSGGNKAEPGSHLLLDRMYFNDGKGNFTLYPRPLSPNGFNTAVVLPIDFDHDGDTDLFVGSRSTSGSYGVPPRHFLYQNNGKGDFQDVAKLRAEDLNLYGMMTDATLADVIPGGDPEIIVTGEWASPAVFQWTDGKLTRVKSNLDEYPGWWYAVRSADLDGD
ncbi:MAG: FG-GAP-like repeat-containing protein, partial [Bacteroidota bacterium]